MNLKLINEIKKEIKNLLNDEEEFFVESADELIHKYFDEKNMDKENKEYTIGEQKAIDNYSYSEYVRDMCEKIVEGEN